MMSCGGVNAVTADQRVSAGRDDPAIGSPEMRNHLVGNLRHVVERCIEM